MILAFALLLQAAAPAAPPPVTPQGQEMVDLFAAMCVETGLSSAKAHALDAQPAIARAMTADELGRVMPGTVATEGWITKSPHDVWGALWFAPAKRTCGVTVRTADPAGMEGAIDHRLHVFFGGFGFPITQRPDEVATESGTTVHRASWTITAGTHELAVIASFADRPIGAHQHLMTMTMLH